MRIHRWLGVAAVAGAAVVACTVPIAHAQEASPDPARQVLAIPSPVVAPVCGASGLATLLVPILGGVVDAQLGLGDVVTIGDVILDALGPAFLVCGTLPGSDGTRCALVDDQIAAVWPGEISDVGFTSPPVGGGVAEGVGNALVLLGLSPLDALDEALRCSIPDGAGTPEAPPAPPPVGGVAPPAVLDTPSDPDVPRPSSGGVPRPSVGAPVATSGAAVVTTPGQPVSIPQTIVDIAFRQVSGAVVLLQLLVALALAAFLLSSWRRSWQLAHASSK